MIEAVTDSKGEILTVTEQQIKSARDQLWKQGIFAETTAAVGIAGGNKNFYSKT